MSDKRGPNTGTGSDDGNPPEKPKLRQITSMEELVSYMEEILRAAVHQLTYCLLPPEATESYVDVYVPFVNMEANINIFGMSREQAVEVALTTYLGERSEVRESDSDDVVYVVQYTRNATAILLSKVLKTDELIRLASGAIALARKRLSCAPGSTLSVVGEEDPDRLWTMADVVPTLKKLLLGRALGHERELTRFVDSPNKPPLVLLTFGDPTCFNPADGGSLAFLLDTEIHRVFRIRDGSKHFFLEVGEPDATELRRLRQKQHKKIDKVLS